MTGAYIAYPYDENGLPVLDADLQSGLATKQDAAAFLTTLVGIGGTSGSGNLARVTSPVLVTPTASRYNLSADTNVSEQASGVVQIGTTAANALGTLACAAVNATGFVSTSFGVRIPSGFGMFLASNGSYDSGTYLQPTASNGKMRLANHGTTGGCHFDINTLDTLTLRNFTDTGAGSLTCANVTASGTVTCGSAGYAMASMGGGDIRLNNGTSDTPGIHWVTANNANWGIDSSGGSLRLVRNLDESGGVVFATWAAAQYQLSSTTTTSLRLTSTGASGKSFDFASDASGSFTIGDGTNNLLTLTSTLATFLRAVVLGVYTVGTLPSASANTRARAFVADSNLAFNSTNLGSTVTAGGSTLVPVFSNGTNWVIG